MLKNALLVGALCFSAGNAQSEDESTSHPAYENGERITALVTELWSKSYSSSPIRRNVWADTVWCEFPTLNEGIADILNGELVGEILSSKSTALAAPQHFAHALGVLNGLNVGFATGRQVAMENVTGGHESAADFKSQYCARVAKEAEKIIGEGAAD